MRPKAMISDHQIRCELANSIPLNILTGKQRLQGQCFPVDAMHRREYRSCSQLIEVTII
jgi:hypothetical protein